MYFNLKQANSDKETLIVLRYFISKKEGRFVYSTGLKINPKDWDKNSKTAKSSRGRVDLSSINRKLNKYSTFLEKTLSHLELNETPITKKILKNSFSSEFNPEGDTNSQFIYFTDFVEDFIKRAPELTNRNTKEKYNATKIKHYKITNNRLKEFEKSEKLRIRIDKFNIPIYDKLVNYLKIKLGYSVNTVGNSIKNVKVFLHKAEELGYSVHPDYTNPLFTVLKEESVSIVFNEEEIEEIFKYDFSNNKRLENCRDLAIIGLWTGLRVSDFLALPDINKNDDFITVQPKKTTKSSGIKVVIPLHHHIKEIISVRGMPKTISDVKFNLYIKEICDVIGFDDIVKGSLLVKDEVTGVYRKKVGMYPKYKLVSSHICRRSFATNLYKMNFPTLSIMSITGHTTEKSFLTYIKVTPTEHAEKLLMHWKEYYENKK